MADSVVMMSNISLQDANNGSLDTYVPYSKRPETYVVPVVFLVMFVSGLIGNISLIFVLIKEKLIKTPSYLYILNLSLGDLTVIIGTVPFVCTIYTFESWPYGEFVCKLSEFMRDVSVGVTVLTLSAMSWDRFRAAFSRTIRQGNRHPQQTMLAAIFKSFPFITSICVWFLSIAFAAPSAYFSFIWEVQVSENNTIFVCYPFPPELGPWYPKAVVLFKCIIYYIIPLFIIVCCYVSIAVHLIMKAKKMSTPNIQVNGSRYLNGDRPRHRSSQRNITKAKIILLLVMLFMVCFFPNHLFMIWFYFNPNSSQEYDDFWHFWRIGAFCLSFINSCLNPITLYMTSEQFKSLFKKHFCFVPNNIRQTAFTDESTSFNTITQRIHL